MRLLKLTQPLMRGEDVKKLQSKLSITSDGWFGRNTYEAVKQFQLENNLVVDGIVGRNTNKVLSEFTKSVITIKRDSQTDSSTMGRLYLNKDLVGYTLELPCKNNQNRISCIPKGEYKAFVRDNSTSKWDYDVIQLKNVPSRNAIQIHRGNNLSHTQGCILVGKTKGENAVWNSRVCMDELMESINDKENIIVKVI